RYQQQIADAIYRGLRKHFAAHPIQSAPQGGPGQTASTNQPGADKWNCIPPPSKQQIRNITT
ncbi:hypothetical protein MJN51_39255, partial [Salmonella enterica subsp. enterica serovar Kentucky]|nr:hypothetical protein [Salmonella enterica subsp. enterica serovar Kentucky]